MVGHISPEENHTLMGELADDYQKMCEFLMQLASSMIDGGGHLAPAGVAVGRDGSCIGMMAQPTSFPIADPEEMERMLIEGLRLGVKSGEYRATGIALELRELRREDSPTVPAIKLILESRAGQPAYYYQPFRRRWFRKPRYEPYFIVKGRSVVFDDTIELS
jgi:hypothetical protein